MTFIIWWVKQEQRKWIPLTSKKNETVSVGRWTSMQLLHTKAHPGIHSGQSISRSGGQLTKPVQVHNRALDLWSPNAKWGLRKGYMRWIGRKSTQWSQKTRINVLLILWDPHDFGSEFTQVLFFVFCFFNQKKSTIWSF